MNELKEVFRLKGQFWYLIYNNFINNEKLYNHINLIFKSQRKKYNPVIKIADADRETHAIINVNEVIDWRTDGRRFKYEEFNPKIFKILNWDEILKKFKSDFKEYYPLELNFPSLVEIMTRKCEFCKVVMATDNFFIDSLECKKCNYNRRSLEGEDNEENTTLNDIKNYINETVKPLVRKVKLLEQENESLKRITYRELLTNFNFRQKHNGSIGIIDEKILAPLDEEVFQLEENIGCVIITFGSAHLNCLPGGIFKPEFDYMGKVDEYTRKMVVYVGFTKNMKYEIQRYRKLKRFNDEIILKSTEILIPKELLHFKNEKFKELVKSSSQSICHVDVIDSELKDENLILIDKDYFPTLKYHIIN